MMRGAWAVHLGTGGFDDLHSHFQPPRVYLPFLGPGSWEGSCRGLFVGVTVAVQAPRLLSCLGKQKKAGFLRLL